MVLSKLNASSSRLIDRKVIQVGVLPVDLALDPEHAKVISAVDADVVAHLVVEIEDIAERRVGRWSGQYGSAADNDRNIDRRIIDENVRVLVLDPSDTGFNTSVALAVPGHCRS